MATATAPPAAPHAATERFGVVRHLALSSFWFGNFFLWQPLTTVVLQGQIDALVPRGSQGTALGLTLGLGGILAMSVPPAVGAYSDRLTSRWGRRRPIMVVGSLVTMAGLAVMASAGSYTVLVVGYLIVQGFFNAAGAAYAGLVPDVVPAQEFGRASGFLATMVQLGSGFGLGATTATAGMDLRLIYSIMGVVVLITLVPTLWVAAGEGTTPIPRKPRLPALKAIREFLRPLAGGDFAWVIFTRFMISAGITSVAYFLFNFFRDVVQVSNPGQFTPTWFLVVLVVAVPFGLAAGQLSDRFGRKIFVYLSGGFQAAVALFFVVFFPTNVGLVYAVGAVYGIGYGCYYAVDWALACDTLPDRTAVAKDMGLFHVALTLPQTYIPFLAGITLDHFNRQSANSGYRVIFSAAVVFLFLGTVFVSRIRPVR